MFYGLSKVGWFVATPSNLLPLLILAALALGLRARWRARALGAALIGVLVLLGAGLLPVANWAILPLEERFPAPADDRGEVQGIIVLGGGVLAEESFARGQLILNEAGERITGLVELARRHPRARLVFSGGGGTLLADEVPEAAAVQRFIGGLGLDPARILVEDRSRTTAENAAFTRALVQPAPGERWLLVTSAWHMPRAVGCFRRAGFPVVAYPVDYRTRGRGDAWRPFTFASEGLRRLDLAAKEWAGLAAYRLAGYTDVWLPSPDPLSGSASLRR